jgi:hypothetical protein
MPPGKGVELDGDRLSGLGAHWSACESIARSTSAMTPEMSGQQRHHGQRMDGVRCLTLVGDLLRRLSDRTSGLKMRQVGSAGAQHDYKLTSV